MIRVETFGHWWRGTIHITMGKLRVAAGINLYGFNIGFNFPSVHSIDLDFGIFCLGFTWLRWRLGDFSKWTYPIIRNTSSDLIADLVGIQPMTASKSNPIFVFKKTPDDYEEPLLWKDGTGQKKHWYTPAVTLKCPNGQSSWMTTEDLVERAPLNLTHDEMAARRTDLEIKFHGEHQTPADIQKERDKSLQFLSQYVKGTELWRYANDAPLAGRWGYCIIKNNTIIALYQTAMS